MLDFAAWRLQWEFDWRLAVKPVNVVARIIAVFRRLGIAIAIAIAFSFGLAATVYLSLRSPEVTVPNVVGTDRFEAERILEKAGLNFRVRASRPSREMKADVVLFQLPRSGQVVKAGQTVAMDISRAAKEGEISEGAIAESPEEKAPENGNVQASVENTNENKPKRPRAVNKNANDSENTNLPAVENKNSATENANAETNLNRATNANAAPTVVDANSTRRPNQNINRIPAGAKASPDKASNRPE